jgi:CheY-like chemotaxis protein
MKSLPILLLNPIVERACDTQFLLQLANYQVSAVYKDDEAFNWIVNRHDSAEQTSLLLINYFQIGMAMLQLIPQLRQQAILIPILFVCRDELSDCTVIASAEEAVFCCRPENMLSQIRSLIG